MRFEAAHICVRRISLITFLILNEANILEIFEIFEMKTNFTSTSAATFLYYFHLHVSILKTAILSIDLKRIGNCWMKLEEKKNVESM